MSASTLDHAPRLWRSLTVPFLAMTLVAVLYVVGFEQGALTGHTAFLHELFHDGRHLLGVPCH
jgi:hypothetical protein